MDIENHEGLLKKLQTNYPAIVLDGAVNNEEWGKLTENRILWVLKETNDYAGDLRELLRQFADASDPNKIYKNWKNTYGAVVQVSYGILNGCLEWGEWAEKVNEIRKTLHKIAVLNVNKLGGKERTDMSKLKESPKENFTLKQIDLIDPDIVILGGVVDVILWPKNDSKRKWIPTDHPGQTTVTHKEYYESIIKKLKG